MWRGRVTGAGVSVGAEKCKNGDSGDIRALPFPGGFAEVGAPTGRFALLKRRLSFMTSFKHAAASESDGGGPAAILRGRESPKAGAERADGAGRESRVRRRADIGEVGPEWFADIVLAAS